MAWLSADLPNEQRHQPTVQVLAGLSGVGKSQVASAHVRRHQQLTWWWVPRDALFEQFAAAAVLFDCAPGDSDTPLAERVAEVRSMFEQTRQPWLLVIDDVSGWDTQLGEVLPQSGPGQIVITSTNPRWTEPPTVNVANINTLSPADAAEFLCARSGRGDRVGARRVAVRLGCLALALEQAAAFLRENRRMTFDDYYKDIDVEPQSLLDRYAPDDHRSTVWRTWRPAIKDCRKTAPASPVLLGTMAFLAAAEVPEDVLVAVLREQKKRSALRKAIADLTKRSLLSRNDDDGLLMHQLVADVTRHTSSADDAERWLLAAIGVANALLDNNVPDTFSGAHIDQVVIHGVAIQSITPPLLRIARHAVDHRSSQDQAHRIDVLRAAISIYDRSATTPPEQWLVELADALLSLGKLERARGDYDPAGVHLEEALAIYRRVGNQRGEADALDGLGSVRRERSDYDAAAALYKEALAIYQHIGNQTGEANALWGLGTGERERSDYDAAGVHLKEALAINRRIGNQLGEANALDSLGTLERARGDYDAAVVHLEETLAIYRRIGSQHGEANALDGLGVVERARGDYDAGVGHLKEALAIYRRIGNQHGEANALTNLGMLERARGDYQAAVANMEEALAIYRRIGNQNGEGMALRNLGAVETRRGDYDKAVTHLEEALAINRRIGNQHGEANALDSLGSVERARGDYDAAVVHLEEALAIYRRIGDQHSEAIVLGMLGEIQGND